MVGMGKECGFSSNFDMPRPVIPRKTKLRRKTELQPIKSPNGLLYPRVEVDNELTLGTRLQPHLVAIRITLNH